MLLLTDEMMREKVGNELVINYSFHHTTTGRCYGNRSVIIRLISRTLFMDRRDETYLPLQGQTLRFQRQVKDMTEWHC